MHSLTASIIINNYNYQQFLGEAIDSALNQTHEDTEVIVVDDGSTDMSRQIIEGFGSRVVPVFKENGGQASAFNAGFYKSHGDIILFLDSDDVLYADAVQNVIQNFNEDHVAKVHWPLDVINVDGVKTGHTIPNAKLPEGDFKEHGLQSGPPFFLNPPTSGNAWSRNFIESIMPVPEAEFKIGADTFLFETVPFFGPIKSIPEPQAAYRIHGKNNYNNKSFLEKLQSELKFYDAIFPMLAMYCQKLGVIANEKIWRENSWFHKVAEMIADIKKVVPPAAEMILVDDAFLDIGNDIEGRGILPFLNVEGSYGGAPKDDEHAISELEILIRTGANYIAFTWISFWWLEEYAALHQYIRLHFNCILENERVVIFDLRKSC